MGGDGRRKALLDAGTESTGLDSDHCRGGKKGPKLRHALVGTSSNKSEGSVGVSH